MFKDEPRKAFLINCISRFIFNYKTKTKTKQN